MSQKDKSKKAMLKVSNVRLVYDENAYNALPPQRRPKAKEAPALTDDSFHQALRRASRKIEPESEKGEK